MNRHQAECRCPCCQSLARIFGILDYGGGFQGFLAGATARIRALEADLRDDLSRAGFTGVGGTCLTLPLPTLSQVPVGAATPAGLVLGPPPGSFAPLKGAGSSQPPAKSSASERKGEGLSQDQPKEVSETLAVKKLAAVPPTSLASPDSREKAPDRVKEEPSESPRSNKPGVREADYGEKKDERCAQEISPSLKRRRSRSHRHSRKADKKSEEVDRRRRRKEEREAEKGEKRSPSREEIPRRGEGASGSQSGRPRPPAGPPPQWRGDKEKKSRSSLEDQGGKGSGARRGPGWIGEIPVSSHYRWTRGKNKGVVKRAKQERFNERRKG